MEIVNNFCLVTEFSGNALSFSPSYLMLVMIDPGFSPYALDSRSGELRPASYPWPPHVHCSMGIVELIDHTLQKSITALWKMHQVNNTCIHTCTHMCMYSYTHAYTWAHIYSYLMHTWATNYTMSLVCSLIYNGITGEMCVFE